MSAAFDFAELFTIASWLFDTRKKPASQCLLRTIANRTYYSGLILASQHTGEPTNGGHANVIEAFKQREGRYYSNKLDELRELRVKADYKPSANMTESDLQMKLGIVREVLAKMGKAPLAAKPYTEDYLDFTKFCVPPSSTTKDDDSEE